MIKIQEKRTEKSLEFQTFAEFWTRELEAMDSDRILHWAIESFAPKLALATAFEPNGCLLISMMSRLLTWIDVIEIDYGHPFYDTNRLRLQLQRRYDVDLVRYEHRKDEDAVIFDADRGRRRNFDRFLRMTDFEAIRREPHPFEILICCDAAPRNSQWEKQPILEWDPRLEIVKVFPLARWSQQAIWNKIDREGIPYSSFFDHGSRYRRTAGRRLAYSPYESVSRVF